MFIKITIQKPDKTIGTIIVNTDCIQDISPLSGVIGRTKATVMNTGMQIGYECIMSMQDWDKALFSDTKVLTLS